MTSKERLENSGAFNLGKTVLVGEGEGCHGFSVHESCCQRRMIDLFFHYHWGGGGGWEMMRQSTTLVLQRRFNLDIQVKLSHCSQMQEIVQGCKRISDTGGFKESLH